MSTPTLESRRGVRIRIDGRDVVSFAGCDYLGLSQHPRVLKSLETGVTDFGLSSSASRTTSGTTIEHVALERELAEFFDRPAAAITSDGFLANVAAADAVVGSAIRDTEEKPRIELDRGSHPSLSIAFAHSAQVVTYDREHGPPRGSSVIATDGVFPGEGVVAHLAQLLERLDPAGHLIVDDCHGVGVLGQTGRGTLDHHGVCDQRVVITGTLSKAFGSHGGYVIGESVIIDAVRSSTAYITATPIPAAVARAARTSLELVRAGTLLSKLRSNCDQFQTGLRSLGLHPPKTCFPVFALRLGDSVTMAVLSQSLLGAGFLVPYIDYPGGPAGGCLRLSVSAEHNREQIEELLDALRDGLEFRH